MVRIRLKEVREKHELSYQQMADEVGITKPYYWQIENGKRGLSYELSVKIASVFGLKPDDIFLPDELTKSELTEKEVI